MLRSPKRSGLASNRAARQRRFIVSLTVPCVKLTGRAGSRAWSDMKTPKLSPVDLKKGSAVKGVNGHHNHPDIKAGYSYLALIDDDYHAGSFSRQWYGWNFSSGGHGAGCSVQLDKPGTNSSRWQGLWRIE